MKHAQQRRRDTLNQPAGWGSLVHHTPGQIPQIENVDALLHVNDRLLAIFRKFKQRAQVGGQARAETYRAMKEQAQKIAVEIWSEEPDLSRRAVACTINKRMKWAIDERTIRKWITPLHPSAL